ncbi:hypothetical protein [Roseibium album]|uniref:Uncharacterized protein n=1 Tax=Roseibium album TaxID=311410 RepID=A0A0M7A615_9HYPH|nr:hypothetical protein [Roseibium album]CTQ58152.1 hypothetical protein LA5094_00909 [Roseibium album]CTQ65695.1 hypothetical protein LA5096_00820 [Roseibium album]CTQ70575.1 hypothetical protein LA5095_01964 [Roseibium album]
MTTTPKKPPENTQGSETRSAKRLTPVVGVNYELYASYLDDPSLSEHDKRDIIETLYGIVSSFVDLGFDVHPLQKVGSTIGVPGPCEQNDDIRRLIAAGMVDLEALSESAPAEQVIAADSGAGRPLYHHKETLEPDRGAHDL